MSRPNVSVVVCTRNRSALLRRALESLTRLETGGEFNYEVLVVDNASSDDTRSIAEQVASRSPVTIRTVRETRLGIASARNRGIEASRGEWIAFFDDDEIAEPSWLAQLLQMAADKGTRCVGGRVALALPRGVGRRLSPVCRMLLGGSVGMDEPRRFNARVTPGTGNLLLHRSVFDEVGRFDETLAISEDTELFLRMHRAGIDAWYTPEAVVHHVIPKDRLGEEYLLRRAERIAAGMAQGERSCGPGWLYPLIWLARLGQAAVILAPRWLLSRLAGNPERALGARCRLLIARIYLREGLGLRRESLR